MIYIRKGYASSEVSQEINRVKRDNNWDKVRSTDKEIARIAFDQVDKSIIRKQLFAEQKHLCAYCMRKIKKEEEQNATIEHWLPVSVDATKTLDYNNMMLCCDGGRKITKTPHIVCCDAAKEDKSIKISPYNREQMERIRYRSSGRIEVCPTDENLQNDIDNVLKLNGEIDKNGHLISDTSTGLVYGRKQVYQNYTTYITSLSKKGKATATIIRKKIDELSQSEEYVEYVGVWLYLLKRKLKSI